MEQIRIDLYENAVGRSKSDSRSRGFVFDSCSILKGHSLLNLSGVWIGWFIRTPKISGVRYLNTLVKKMEWMFIDFS